MQTLSRPKTLRLFLAALVLSIVFLSAFFYRFGLYQNLPDEDSIRTNAPTRFDPTPALTAEQRISRIRSHEIRDHAPDLVRFHAPDEGPRNDTFRVAYLIVVHNAETIQGAISILNRLFDKKHTFVIHLDTKANNSVVALLYNSLAKFKSSVSNPADPRHFTIAPHNNLIVLVNHPISWCGFTMIQATFDMISAALQTTRWFDSVVLLSGSCHPVKPPFMIERKLKELRGMLLLKLDGTGGFDDRGIKTGTRYDHWSFDVYFTEHNGLGNLGIKKNYPEGLIRRVGTQWVSLSREFSEYVITSPWARKLFVTHSSSLCADESMFQLIANNSPFVNNTFASPRPEIRIRFEDWGKDGRLPHPETLTAFSVMPAIQGPALFARKFKADNNTRSYVDRVADQMWPENSEH